MFAKTFARPIIPILITYMAGIVCGERFPGSGGWAIGTIVVGLTAVGWRLWQQRATFIAPIILFLAMGYLSIQPWTAPVFPSHHITNHADSQKWIVTGIIAEHPVVRPMRQSLIVAATDIKTKDRHYEVCGRVRVTVGGGDLIDLNRGDRIRVTGRLKRVYGFHNPGGFDYERYLAFQKIWCRMWASHKRVVILEPLALPTHVDRAGEIRRTVAQLIDHSVSGESRQVLKALVIGDRTGISPSLREIFNRTGIGHLLAISGLHIGIVASVVFFLFKWLLSYSRFLLHRAWTGKIAAILTFIPVLSYGVVAGMSPSTQRATVMVAAFLLAYLAGKIQDAFNTLALAGVVILAVYPPALFSISFQLSFTAVAFIILGISRPWPTNRSKAGPRFPIMKKAGSLMAVTALATLGTLPLVMQTFNEVSLIGIGTNLLAVPLVGFIIVPIGLLGMFIHWLSTSAAMICFSIAGYLLDVTLAVTHFLANLPFASLKTITPSMTEVVLYYVLVSMGFMLAPALLAYLKGLNWRSQSGLTGDTDMKILAAISLLAGMVAVTDVGYWTYQRYWHRDLKVTVIDVGTGSATLVEFPRGPVMLIDGGGFSDNSVFDMGAKVVAPVLWRKKIMTVDTMVLSHPNSDHLNGLIYIAEHFKVGRLWSNGEASDTRGYRKLKALITQRKISSPSYQDLAKVHEINGVKVSILHPPKAFMQKDTDEHSRDTNNNSLVVKVSISDFSFLIPGDIEKKAEKELVALRPDELASTILMAPHHGSRTSSTSVFLDAISPEAVIISCARSGRYHFPHPTILKRYHQRGCQVFSTARNGAIQMVTDGRKIKIRSTIEAISSPI